MSVLKIPKLTNWHRNLARDDAQNLDHVSLFHHPKVNLIPFIVHSTEDQLRTIDETNHEELQHMSRSKRVCHSAWT